jgi:energy-coupling factor transporter ATP-binding protein EcfA2
MPNAQAPRVNSRPTSLVWRRSGPSTASFLGLRARLGGRTRPRARRLSVMWTSSARPAKCTHWWGRKSGKSTVIKIASGVSKPDTGEVVIGGESLSGRGVTSCTGYCASAAAVRSSAPLASRVDDGLRHSAKMHQRRTHRASPVSASRPTSASNDLDWLGHSWPLASSKHAMFAPSRTICGPKAFDWLWSEVRRPGRCLSQSDDTCDSANSDAICACRALVDAMAVKSGVVASAPVKGDRSSVGRRPVLVCRQKDVLLGKERASSVITGIDSADLEVGL